MRTVNSKYTGKEISLRRVSIVNNAEMVISQSLENG